MNKVINKIIYSIYTIIIVGRVAADPPIGINTNQAHIENQAHIDDITLALDDMTLAFDKKCGSLDPMLSELMKNSNLQEMLSIIQREQILLPLQVYQALLDSIKASIVKQDQLIQRIENLELVFQLIESTKTQLSTIAQNYKGTALTDNLQKTIIQLVEKIVLFANNQSIKNYKTSIDEYGKITDMENRVRRKKRRFEYSF